MIACSFMTFWLTSFARSLSRWFFCRWLLSALLDIDDAVADLHEKEKAAIRYHPREQFEEGAPPGAESARTAPGESQGSRGRDACTLTTESLRRRGTSDASSEREAESDHQDPETDWSPRQSWASEDRTPRSDSPETPRPEVPTRDVAPAKTVNPVTVYVRSLNGKLLLELQQTRYRHLLILPLKHFVCGLLHICPNTCHLIYGHDKLGLDEKLQNRLVAGSDVVDLILYKRGRPPRVAKQAASD